MSWRSKAALVCTSFDYLGGSTKRCLLLCCAEKPIVLPSSDAAMFFLSLGFQLCVPGVSTSDFSRRYADNEKVMSCVYSTFTN